VTARYRNSFYQGVHGSDPEFYQTDVTPIEHAGCLIYQRIKGVCWDTVKDGVCIAQRGGIEGAKLAAERVAAGKHPRGPAWDVVVAPAEPVQGSLFSGSNVDGGGGELGMTRGNRMGHKGAIE
jgi:hypothetical protein